ncbi:hypothetical protein [Paraburkholderia tropica]|uniref:hypothetical protein n=1 Tax=Paraburkholderia tropica TaxID=92647 RepID=UPI002AB29AC8|nr:hypothetical protein [Paraburkholderia tropica]
MSFDQLSRHRDQVGRFEAGRQADIKALAERRKRADADLARCQAKLSRDSVTAEDGARLEAELVSLKAKRTNEVGMAHADGRKANTAKIDKEIKAKQDEIAAYHERAEAARAALPILEDRLAAARQRHASEVAAINEEVEAAYNAIASKWDELGAALGGYLARVRERVEAYKGVSTRYLPVDLRGNVRPQGAAYEQCAAEMARLASLGLPENRASARQTIVAVSVGRVSAPGGPRIIGGQVDNGPYANAGVFSADGQRIG